ncbi:MAG: hypothetical protein PHC56_04215 [Herbinix sp.]|nr:hypothetical protein [Herbinix sp.]
MNDKIHSRRRIGFIMICALLVIITSIYSMTIGQLKKGRTSLDSEAQKLH